MKVKIFDTGYTLMIFDDKTSDEDIMKAMDLTDPEDFEFMDYEEIDLDHKNYIEIIHRSSIHPSNI